MSFKMAALNEGNSDAVQINGIKKRKTGQKNVKKSKKKSGQAISETFLSKWMFSDQLYFLCLAMASTKSRGNFSATENNVDDSFLECGSPPKKATLKKLVAKRNLELLSR